MPEPYRGPRAGWSLRLFKLGDPDQAKAVLRRKLSNNRESARTDVLVRAVTFSAATARSRYCLRHATSLGVGIRILGRPPVIRNEGSLVFGNDVKLEAPIRPIYFRVHSGAELTLGEGVAVNEGVRLECTCSIRVGDRVHIGFGAVLIDNSFHDVYDRTTRPPGRPIVVEDDAWIGARAIVLPGVRIGEGAIVGAGAIVSKDVPPFTVVAGNPAQVVRSLSAELFTRQAPASTNGSRDDR